MYTKQASNSSIGLMLKSFPTVHLSIIGRTCIQTYHSKNEANNLIPKGLNNTSLIVKLKIRSISFK